MNSVGSASKKRLARWPGAPMEGPHPERWGKDWVIPEVSLQEPAARLIDEVTIQIDPGEIKSALESLSGAIGRMVFVTTQIGPSGQLTGSRSERRFNQTHATPVSVEPVFERLEELTALESDWDTYGGEPPMARAVATAGRLVTAAWAQLGERFGSRALPYELMPIADGGLQLEWRAAHDRLELNVGPQGAISFLHVAVAGEGRTYREGDDLPQSEALALVERVARA